MQCKTLLTGLLILLIAARTEAQHTARAFAEKHGNAAVVEMQKYGIPASITLAQAIIESGAGRSKLSQLAKNHFGVRAGKAWKGKRFGNFRYYEDDQSAFDDRSAFLARMQQYAPLFKLDMCDYKAWAQALQKAGYATNPRYAAELIKCIEQNDLHKWDEESCEELWEHQKIHELLLLQSRAPHADATPMPNIIRRAIR